MANIPQTALEQLSHQLSEMPLWIKQVVFTQLRTELESTVTKATLDTFGTDDMLQLWVPEVTRLAVAELEAPSGRFSQGACRLLQAARFKKNSADITILNKWSLEQTSVYLRECIENELVVKPRSGLIIATVDYLSGKTRLGEYLVKINRVTVEQLDQALRTQRYIQESMGQRTGIANVLINLGYINKQDSEGILFLKEESKKPFAGLNAPQQVQSSLAPGGASAGYGQQQAPQQRPPAAPSIAPQAGQGWQLNNPATPQ